MNGHHYYRSVIIKNTNNPAHLVTKPLSGAQKIVVHSDFCSESYDIFLILKNNVISDAKFRGYGCLISKAALNIVCSLIKSKSQQEALTIIKNYQAMVYQKPFNKELIGDLIIFQSILAYPSRIACALLGSNGIKKYLSNAAPATSN